MPKIPILGNRSNARRSPTRLAALAVLLALVLCQPSWAQRNRGGSNTTAVREIFGSTFVTTGEYVNPKTGGPGLYWTTQSPFGSGANSNATSGEEEEYISTTSPLGPNPFAITASGLTITASPTAGLPNGLKYTSGCLSTKGIEEFSPPYYVEMIAKMPTGPSGPKGSWLTFEMFTDDWSKELDICQFSGLFPTQEYPALLSSGTEKAGNFVSAGGVDLTKSFHSYGVNVTTSGVTWYVDRKQVMSSSQRLTKPMYITVNLAVGDGGGAFVGTDNGSSYTVTIKSVVVWNGRPF